MFNYVILNNGAYIYDTNNKTCESLGVLDNKLIREVFKHFKDKSHAIDLCSYDKYYMYRKVVEDKPFLKKINDIDEIKQSICRINIFADNEILDEYYSYIIKKYGNKTNTFIMMDSDDANDLRWIAINPKNLNKGVAIEHLCDQIGITLNECIFFADGPNDIEALEMVGLGVAMGNAFDEVKRNANDITLSNDEDGIANYLKRKLNI